MSALKQRDTTQRREKTSPSKPYESFAERGKREEVAYKTGDDWHFFRGLQLITDSKHVHNCSKYPVYGSSSVELKQTTNSFYSFGGLKTCKNHWLCPRCAKIYARKSAGELEKKLAAATKKGYVLYFVTVTLPHRCSKKLEKLWEEFNTCMQGLYNSSQVVKLYKSRGYHGAIHAWDLTHSQNGWHLHRHDILSFSFEVPELQSTLNTVLEALKKKHGIVGGVNPVHVLEVKGTTEFVAKYVAGWTNSKQAVASEIASIKKVKRVGSSSPWDLAKEAMDGSRTALCLWHEFEAASKGHKRMSKSGEFKSKPVAGDGPKKEEPIVLVSIWEDTFKNMWKTGWDTYILALCRNGRVLEAVERVKDMETWKPKDWGYAPRFVT